jgi:hypothetical protein
MSALRHYGTRVRFPPPPLDTAQGTIEKGSWHIWFSLQKQLVKETTCQRQFNCRPAQAAIGMKSLGDFSGRGANE